VGFRRFAELQDRLYAQDKWAVLAIFQAMDAAGKDGAIKACHVGCQPAGMPVFSFKSPSAEDLDHDYLWRCIRCLPNRGHIGIFNRSYYEETLVVRVHPEFLAKQKIPSSLITKDIRKKRFRDIRSFEPYLAATALWWSNSFCTCRRRNSNDVSWKERKRPKKTGSSPLRIWLSAITGTNTSAPTRI